MLKTIAIIRVRIRNFRSIKDADIAFPQEPGLRFLGGQNLEEPRLGANGAGKSTLWKAIIWCFFGSGEKGEKVSNLVSWGAEDTEIWITLQVSDKIFVIKRTGPPNKVFLDDIPVEQYAIEQLIGLSKLRFQHTVIFGQGQRLFPDLSIPERGELLEEVLNLAFWAKCSETTSIESTRIFSLLSLSKRELAGIEGALNSVDPEEFILSKKNQWEEQRTSRVETIKQSAAGWITTQNVKLAKIQSEANQFFQDQKLELVDLETKEKEWRERTQLLVESMIQEVEGYEAAIKVYDQIPNPGNTTNDLRQQQILLNKKISKLDSEDNQNTNYVVALTKSEDYWRTTKVCSVCTQPISEEKREEQLNQTLQKRKTIEDKSIELILDRNSSYFELEQVNTKIKLAEQTDKAFSKAVSERASCILNIDRLTLRVETYGRELENSPYEQQKSALKKRKNPSAGILARMAEEINPYLALISSEENSVNPFDREIVEAQIKRVNLQSKLNSKQTEVQVLEGELNLVEYWKYGFKRLRVFLMNRVLSALQVEVSSAISTLGLEGWKIEFKSETETKSGTTKLGIQLLISSPKSQTPVPWESWSGGESQRLRQAVALGLASLIQRASGCWWNIEVFDEPSTYLSVEGVENLMETLDYRSQSCKKSIWVVDHTALSYSDFKEIWFAIKEKVTGTRFQLTSR